MILISQLSIRMRLLLAILAPVVLTAIVSAAVSVSEIRSNGDAELQRLQQGLLEARKEGLKDVVETALSIVEATSQNRSTNESEAKEEALRRLRAIDFGDMTVASVPLRIALTLIVKESSLVTPGLRAFFAIFLRPAKPVSLFFTIG